MEKVGNFEKSWDKYYYNICIDVADNSKCWSRGIGAILVKDKHVISMGYNGPPRGMVDCGKRTDISPDYVKERTCPRYAMGYKSGEGLDYCPAVHAEENSILTCARMGVVAKDSIMYMTCGIPCRDCMKKIMNVGIKELVCTNLNYYDELSKYMVEKSNVKIRLYDFIAEKN